MEPLHPKVRQALKRAYPNLKDEDIDTSEELLDQRMHADPDTEREKIAELDRRRMELIQRTMPQYSQIVRQVQAEMNPPIRAKKQNYSVEIKSPDHKE